MRAHRATMSCGDLAAIEGVGAVGGDRAQGRGQRRVAQRVPTAFGLPSARRSRRGAAGSVCEVLSRLASSPFRRGDTRSPPRPARWPARTAAPRAACRAGGAPSRACAGRRACRPSDRRPAVVERHRLAVGAQEQRSRRPRPARSRGRRRPAHACRRSAAGRRRRRCPRICGSTSVSTSWIAIAASMALPPARSIWQPASAASGLAAATMWRCAQSRSARRRGTATLASGWDRRPRRCAARRARARPQRPGDAATSGTRAAVRASAGVYFGCMRIAPSRRIVSPLSMTFSMMCAPGRVLRRAAEARREAAPCLPSASCTSCGMPSSIGVSKMPGAMVTRGCRCAPGRARSAGSCRPRRPSTRRRPPGRSGRRTPRPRRC